MKGKRWLLTAAHCITGMKSFDLNFKNFREENFHIFEEKYKNKINIRVGDYINDDSDSKFSDWENQQGDPKFYFLVYTAEFEKSLQINVEVEVEKSLKKKSKSKSKKV